jgi:predicted TIM-barrel fold metal-dependent hydrolase
MYEKNGKKYFIVDGHIHFWDASPANWVKGQDEYAKGWIECFHAYMGLGPAETHWPIEKFMKYSEEDFVKDEFEDGGVDVGIFQSTYLKEWYTTGFNTVDVNAKLAEKYPGKLITNGRWDPREGEAGLKQLEQDAKRYNLQGVKLYTAEWYNGSRVGEDKMLFGSDYGIWEPKWQIDGFLDWDYPDQEYSDYPRLNDAGKRKILGLNAARLYGIEVPAEFRLPGEAGTPAAKEDAQLVESAAG